MRNWGL